MKLRLMIYMNCRIGHELGAHGLYELWDGHELGLMGIHELWDGYEIVGTLVDFDCEMDIEWKPASFDHSV